MKTRFGCFVAIAALTACLLAMTAVSQTGRGATAPDHPIVAAAELKWTPLLKGCELAPVLGDPNTEGTPFVLRLRCAGGTIIPAHWHPTDENVTVLEGTFQVGLGEKFDKTKVLTMKEGDFVSMPKEMRHYAFSKSKTVVQVHGVGPFKVNWVNAADVQPPDAPAKK
jgi:quercetin dioxygenase-like cupin family protein